MKKLSKYKQIRRKPMCLYGLPSLIQRIEHRCFFHDALLHKILSYLVRYQVNILLLYTEAYSEYCQTSKMDYFAKIVNDFYLAFNTA